MAQEVLISRDVMTSIADAIRTKGGTSAFLKPINMADAIASLPGGAYNWMGANVTCLDSNIYSSAFYLSATTYSTWTPSTVAKAFVASKNLSTFEATNMSDYAYMLRWIVEAHVSQLSGATFVTMPTRQINIIDQVIMRRPTALSHISADNFNGNLYLNELGLSWMQYYNSAGTFTYTWAATYGFYGAAAAPAFNSTTALSPIVTPRTPSLYARCSSTIFAVARASEIDLSNTYWNVRGMLYRMDADCCLRQRYEELVDVINNSPFSSNAT